MLSSVGKLEHMTATKGKERMEKDFSLFANVFYFNDVRLLVFEFSLKTNILGDFVNGIMT